MLTYLAAILCVVGLTIGQILFKISASSMAGTGSFFAFKTLITLMAAMAIYAVTSVAWVWILQKVSLGRVYPIMALAFVLVPLGSYFIFGERFQTQYVVGVLLICSGIILAVTS